MKADKEIIANEIRNLIPIESFRKPYHGLYNSFTNLWGEELEKHLSKDHDLEVIDGELIIAKRQPEREPFEQFLHDATRTSFDEDEQPSFATILEDMVNETGRRKILI